MIFVIPEVLSATELEQITATLAKTEFVDGKLTAGKQAKLVKENQQVKADTPVNQECQEIVINALKKNALFQSAIRPNKIHSLRFSRYQEGMFYGRHTDNALMGEWRSDVSFTLFLCDRYDGGELIIESADDEKAYKLAARSAIVYPASTLHRVEPVTQGTRLVAVGWVQSRVRDAAEREILFDLEVVKRSLFARKGKSPEVDLLSKSISNLLRKWLE